MLLQTVLHEKLLSIGTRVGKPTTSVLLYPNRRVRLADADVLVLSESMFKYSYIIVHLGHEC